MTGDHTQQPSSTINNQQPDFRELIKVVNRLQEQIDNLEGKLREFNQTMQAIETNHHDMILKLNHLILATAAAAALNQGNPNQQQQSHQLQQDLLSLHNQQPHEILAAQLQQQQHDISALQQNLPHHIASNNQQQHDILAVNQLLGQQISIPNSQLNNLNQLSQLNNLNNLNNNNNSQSTQLNINSSTNGIFTPGSTSSASSSSSNGSSSSTASSISSTLSQAANNLTTQAANNNNNLSSQTVNNLSTQVTNNQQQQLLIEQLNQLNKHNKLQSHQSNQNNATNNINNNNNNNNNGHAFDMNNNSIGANLNSLVGPASYSHNAAAVAAAAAASMLMTNNPHYQTVRTKYSTRRYSRRRVGPEEAKADPGIRSTVDMKMPVVAKTILIVLKHRLTVQTAITLACEESGERLRKGAIQKKLEAMFREPGAVEQFLTEWDNPRG